MTPPFSALLPWKSTAYPSSVHGPSSTKIAPPSPVMPANPGHTTALSMYAPPLFVMVGAMP